MPDPREPSRQQASPSQCLRCGYDLRGNSSGTCPECGTGVPFMVRINDAEQYHRARAALERDGLLIQFLDPGANLGSVGMTYGMANLAGWLWVDANHLQRVEHILDDIGVASSIGALPIVDRSEPECPRCNVALDPNGPEQCSQCGAVFQWVEIEEPCVDPSGKTCHKCGYELTGNLSGGRCPECSAPLPAEVVADAAAKELEHARRATDGQPPLERVAIPRILDVLLLVLLITIVAFLLKSEEWEILQVALLAAGTAVAGYFINKYVRQRRR